MAEERLTALLRTPAPVVPNERGWIGDDRLQFLFQTGLVATSENKTADKPRRTGFKSIDARAVAKQMLWRVQLVNWRVLLVTNL